MKTTRLAVVIAVCLLVLGMVAVAAAAPKINFPQTEKVYKEVPEGKPLVADFPFTNEGDQNLLIGEVSPSCGCTASSYDKITKPGQGGKVTLELDTEGITGSFRKTAVVATNDPSNPFITLVLSGETKSRIKVQPSRNLQITGCVGQEGLTATATLSDPDGKPLMVSGLDNPMAEYLDAKVEPGSGNKTYKLTLTSKAAEPIEYAGPIFVKSPGQPRTSLWVVVKINGVFTVRPHDVFFGTAALDAKTPPTRTILIKRACADTLKVDQILYDQDKFTVVKSLQKNGDEMILEITPNLKNLGKGHFEQRLSIQSGDRMFTVRLSGNVS